MFEFSYEIIAWLVFAAFFAGMIDAIAGGGGLITLPALLLAGATPIEAIGTNKIQSVFGSGSATWSYARKGHVDLRKQIAPACFAFLGAVLGAICATKLPQETFRAILPYILIGIALYFALKPDMSDVDKTARLTPFLFGFCVVPLIGFYDGVFGPGTGSFFMLAFIALAGYGVLKATAHTKLLNFASNLGGLLAFAVVGTILFKTGLIMGIAQFLGARIGASLAMRNGAKIIKPLLVIVCTALAIRLMLV